jgi:glycosyltransferase involved in cell wall biosynthesis
VRRGACLNIYGIQNPEFSDRGIARYIAEHARGLLQVSPDSVHSLRASPDLSLTPNLVGLLPTGLVQRTHREPVDTAGRAPAIMHVMSPMEWGFSIDEVWPRWARRPEVATAVTLYDVIPKLFPERYLTFPRDRIAYAARLELIRSADRVFAISECTAADAVAELGVQEERITVINAGATTGFLDTWSSSRHAVDFVRQQFPRIPGAFVFYVAGPDPRKNIAGLIQAWARTGPSVRERHRLVVACHLPPARRAEFERTAAAAGLGRDELVLTGRVTDRELAALYRACALFVFASLYEGSGLPIIEAMTAGAPVLAASTSTGPEILGGTEGTFDPAEPEDMAREIRRALEDPELLGRYRARSRARVGAFSWNGVAERTVEGYEATLRAHGRRRERGVRRLRKRIALIAPGPRPRCAADDAWERLVTLLGDRGDVDLIRDAEDASSARPSAHFQLEQARGRYDGVVHVLGGSPAHRVAYEALAREPGGVVVFEDVHLAGFHHWYAQEGGAGALWGRRVLAAQYGGVVSAEIEARGLATPEEAELGGLLFTQEIQRMAGLAVAPCALAAQLLDADRRGETFATPVVVSSPPPPPPDPRRAADAAGRPPFILSPEAPLGHGALALLDAVTLLREGEQPEAFVSLLGDRTSAGPLLAGESPPPWVDAPASATAGMRAARLARATVAVLPVAATDARRIAFAQECLASGVPVVAAGRGWAAELPSGVVELTAEEPSSAQLADAIAAVAADAERARALAHAGLEHVAASADSAAARWHDIIGLA